MPGTVGKFEKGIPHAKGPLINEGGHVSADDSPVQSCRAITWFLTGREALPKVR